MPQRSEPDAAPGAEAGRAEAGQELPYGPPREAEALQARLQGRLAAALIGLATASLAAIGPVAAQESRPPEGGIEAPPLPEIGEERRARPGEDAPGPLEHGAETLMQELLDRMRPQIDTLEDRFAAIEPQLRAMAPMLRELSELAGSLDDYHAPERLPNGDILLRHLTPEELAARDGERGGERGGEGGREGGRESDGAAPDLRSGPQGDDSWPELGPDAGPGPETAPDSGPDSGSGGSPSLFDRLFGNDRAADPSARDDDGRAGPGEGGAGRDGGGRDGDRQRRDPVAPDEAPRATPGLPPPPPGSQIDI